MWRACLALQTKNIILSVLHKLCKPGINSFLASGDFYSLLITFANSLDPDQDRQNVGPDLGPNRSTL